MNSFRLRLCFWFIAALALTILPMPGMVANFRPPWIVLLVLYVEYFLPGNFKPMTLLLTGLLLDVLLATVIGEHSFALLLVTWIASSKSRRFQFFSMMQQICLVGFFCLIYQFVIVLIDGLLSVHYSLFSPCAMALTAAFFWPWVRLLGDGTLVTRLPSYP